MTPEERGMFGDPARALALEAERLQPTPRPAPRTVPNPRIRDDDLAELLDEAAATPSPRQSQAAARREDYTFCRASGDSIAAAAARVGITEATARQKYEPLYQKGIR